MRKQIFVLILILLLTVAVLVGCNGSKEEATPTTEEPTGSITETSTAPSTQTESPSEDVPQTTETEPTEEHTTAVTEQTEETEVQTELELPIEDPIRVLYCSYTENPYFAMVGTCNEGATVEAKIGEHSYSSKSYKGWFSLRLPCEGGSVDVSLTQTLNGKTYSEPMEYTAWPQTPGSGRWPMVTGQDFQFFLQKMLPDFQHENIDDQEVYDHFQSRIEERLETVHSYNPDAEIIYLIVPSSMTMYPELVPQEYKQGSGMSRLDKVTEAINKAGATTIDLKAVFEEHKYDEMPLYYKLDSHWSDYGAYIAYRALFEHISRKFPGAAPRDVDDFNWNPNYYQSGDLTYYLGMPQSEIKEYAYYRTFAITAPNVITNIPRYRYETMLFYSDNVTWDNKITTNRPALPSCMVIRDSYSTQMYDLIAERMDTTHYRGMWNYSWDSSTIKQEQPDYIIYLVAEWNIDSLLK